MCLLDAEIIIIGAGISGLGAAIKLKKHGFHSFLLLEQKNALGGTWLSHDYPGVEADTLSFSYSYSQESNALWPRMYSTGSQVKDYLKRCASKYNLHKNTRYNAKVSHIRYCSDSHTWSVYVNANKPLKARFIISATSIFNQTRRPNIPGFDSFKGKLLWPTHWDHHYDLAGKNIAVIGTGASGVQIIPAIQSKVNKLFVYQRTANWIYPKINPPVPRFIQRLISVFPVIHKLIQFSCNLFTDILYFGFIYYKYFPFLIWLSEAIILLRLRVQVKNKTLRKSLTPTYHLGCKRPLMSSEYLNTMTLNHVELVTEKIKKITSCNIVTSNDKRQQIDAIVPATGFNIFEPGNFPGYAVYGKDNIELDQFWQTTNYQAYAGMAIPHFPNYFLVTGPHSMGISWFSMIEPNINLILRCLKKARKLRASAIEIKSHYHNKQQEKLRRKMKRTVFADPSCRCTNSYLKDNHGTISLPSPFLPIHRKWVSKVLSLDVFHFYTDESHGR